MKYRVRKYRRGVRPERGQMYAYGLKEFCSAGVEDGWSTPLQVMSFMMLLGVTLPLTLIGMVGSPQVRWLLLAGPVGLGIILIVGLLYAKAFQKCAWVGKDYCGYRNDLEYVTRLARKAQAIMRTTLGEDPEAEALFKQVVSVYDGILNLYEATGISGGPMDKDDYKKVLGGQAALELTLRELEDLEQTHLEKEKEARELKRAPREMRASQQRALALGSDSAATVKDEMRAILERRIYEANELLQQKGDMRKFYLDALEEIRKVSPGPSGISDSSVQDEPLRALKR